MTISLAEKEVWHSLFAAGLTAAQIAEKRGCSTVTVWKTVGRQTPAISMARHSRPERSKTRQRKTPEQAKKVRILPVAKSEFIRPLTKEELMGGGRAFIKPITIISL